MIVITIPAQEMFDESTNRFLQTKAYDLQLEHSLIALSKWESKWKKAFLNNSEVTPEETIDYVKCMTINRGIPDEVYKFLTPENMKTITDYIADPMTATTFSDNRHKPNREIITAELIYYWMIANSIPLECEKWHLNRLLTLIRVCSIKNNGNSKKMSKREALSQQASLNQQRRAAAKKH